MAERRVTSVLFGDLVGFTTLSENRDPEQVRELLSRYFDAARTIVQRYGGTVEKFIGDAVMAVWGVPVAHEDDAERCVRAGLDLTDMVTALGEELATALALRVGIVTGEVAVTLGATGEGMVAGDAVNSAARVESLATPGTVWVDDATRQLTAAAVDYVDEGQHSLKGKSSPLRLYRARQVVAARGGAQRVDGLEAPFTGRDRELRLVKELFHATTEDARPRLVLVSGTAGSGKSRLGWEFEKYIDGLQGSVRWHRGRCLAYGEGVAFWALAEMVRSRLELAEGDSGETMLVALDASLRSLVPDEQERLWLRSRLAVLLGAELREFPREDLFAAWTVFLHRVCEGQDALVLLVEDLQHADEGLLDYLDHALETAQFPLFVLGLSRPELSERRSGVGTGRRSTTVHLEPLGETAMAVLVDGLVADLPPAARAGLVERAEGVPLYAVETVRALIDRDAVVARGGSYVIADPGGTLDLLAVGAPASLQALVAGRLDALAPGERALVQDAAVLGMSFSRSGLAALSVRPDLDGLLNSLVRKEILTTRVGPRSPERGQYRFVQAVVRQVGYDTLSRRDRKARHLAVAGHLGAEPDVAQDLAGVLAQHYLDAAANSSPGDGDEQDLIDRARVLLSQAAQRAQTLGSPAEALRHYRTALDLPRDDDSRPDLLEGAARAALFTGQAGLAHDLAAEAVAAHLAAGRNLAAARATAVQGHALMRQREMTATLALLDPVYRSLDGQPGAELVLLDLLEVLGRASFNVGDVVDTRRYCERMLLLSEAIDDHERLATALMAWAIVWFGAGSPTAGQAMLEQSVVVARRHQLQGPLMRALQNVSAFQSARDVRAAIDAAEESFRLAEQAGNQVQAEWSAVNLAVPLWTAGRWGELRELLRTTHAREQELWSPACLFTIRAWLAAACGEPPETLPAGVAAVAAGEERVVRPWALLAMALEAGADHPQRRSELCLSAARHAFESIRLEDDFVYFWVEAVEQAVAAGDATAAEEMLALVLSSPAGLITPYIAAQLPRLQALTAELRGQTTGLEAHLYAAVNALATFGAPFPQAQAELALGRFLLRESRHKEASEALDRAAALFTSLGAAPFLTQVDALRGQAVVPAS